VDEEVVELAPLAREAARVEEGAEGALHRDDAGADGDAAAEPALQRWRPGEVVGVDVRLEDPGEAQLLCRDEGEQRLQRPGSRAPRLDVEVEHRVDDRARAALSAVHDVGDGAAGAVVEGLDEGRHAFSLYPVATIR